MSHPFGSQVQVPSSSISSYRASFSRALLNALKDCLTPSLITSAWIKAGLYNQTSMDCVLRSLPSFGEKGTQTLKTQDKLSGVILTSKEILELLEPSQDERKVEVENGQISVNNQKGLLLFCFGVFLLKYKVLDRKGKFSSKSILNAQKRFKNTNFIRKTDSIKHRKGGKKVGPMRVLQQTSLLAPIAQRPVLTEEDATDYLSF